MAALLEDNFTTQDAAKWTLDDFYLGPEVVAVSAKKVYVNARHRYDIH